MEDLTAQVSEIVIVVVGAALTMFLAWVKRAIKDRVENDYVQGLLQRTVDAVDTAVRESAQIMVPLIKEAATDGKISDEERVRLKEAVRKSAAGQLTKFDREKLESLFDKEELERKFDSLIEAAVQRLKSKG